MAMPMASSSAASVAVDKATSDLLITPDWTMNIDICDSVNSNHWLAKDVVKAVKKRLQHKNPRVQFLALTLLETMVKNCGEFVHFQIAEKNILGEMVKIVKKKTDMQVRDKILVLLDSWQEAFGGPGGKYPQYYWSYEELRRSGVPFPPRTLNASPIFTPPATHSTLRPAEPGYGMPGGSSRRLDETMATEIEGLSLSSLESMRNVMELLGDMLQAVSPNDREAVKEEVIVDLVEHCRSNQKKLVQMLTTTGDEEVLVRGLELNDSLQILLAKHDAIASGLPIPSPVSDFSPKQIEGSSSSTKPPEVKNSPPVLSAEPIMTRNTSPVSHANEDDEEEEDDFAKLARRHTKNQPSPTQTSNDASGALVPIETGQTSPDTASSFSATSNALAIVEPVKNTQEQDIIDLLSITLSTDWSSPPPQPNSTPHQAASSTTQQSLPQIPVSSGTQPYPGIQGPASFDSYVVPWAQPQPSQSQPQPLHYHQHQQQFQPQFEPQLQPQQQYPPQQQYQYPQYSSAYPPPPWAATPGYANGSSSSQSYSMPHRTTAATPMQHQHQQQQSYGNSSNGSNGTAMNGDPLMGFGARGPPPAQPAVSKPFVPSYRLFEDLNVLGNGEGKFKVNGSTAPSLSSSSGQSMVGGRK